MRRISPREPMRAPGLLRVDLSRAVSPSTLRALHKSGLTPEAGAEIQELIKSVGGERMSAVYPVSDEEIEKDDYGFARQFQVVLQPGTDAERAARQLERSHLVERVSPVLLSERS